MTEKLFFQNDYATIAHPRILEAMSQAAGQNYGTYGLDSQCGAAADTIRNLTGAPKADVHFIAGGTLTNLVNLSVMLRPFESVIACDTGHICVHEAGAIEATGHKINLAPNVQGKLTPATIEGILDGHHSEHMVVPKVVYLSQSTELGTVYTKSELEDISRTCRNNGLYLYIDGARLSCALAALEDNLSLSDLARLSDMFYIGGTKNGALFGEAVVIVNEDLQDRYRYTLKQRGALMAKGMIAGVQFQELLKDGLYMDIARHANHMAAGLADIFKQAGHTLLTPQKTNMVFPVLPEPVIEKLEETCAFYRQGKTDDGVAIRLVTSWATREEDVRAVERLVLEL
jgi:threonine aldolase